MATLLEKKTTPCDAWLSRGLSAFERGDASEALQCFRRAAGNDIKRAEAWYWTGRAQEALGEPQSAAYCYSLAMDLGHGFSTARQALQRLGYLRGGLVTAFQD